MEEAISFVAVVAVLGVTTQKVVEFIRTLVAFSGNVTRLIAWVVGTVFAFSFSLDAASHVSALVGAPIRDFPDIVDYLIAGLFIAAASGYAADRAGRTTKVEDGRVAVVGVPRHGAEVHDV
jgi:hypothetical protein